MTTEQQANDFWSDIRRSGIPPDSMAEQMVAHVEQRLREHPNRCLPTVLDLTPGQDYELPKKAHKTLHQLDPESLRGLARLVWQKCERFPARWIEQRLSPNSHEELFAIVVHGPHDVKHLCGRHVARKIDRETFDRALGLLRRDIVPKLVVVYAGNSPDDTSYRTELERHASRIGVVVESLQIEGEPTVKGVRDLLHVLNNRSDVHGVLVQTIRDAEITNTIRETLAYSKDPEHISSRRMGQVLFSGPKTPVAAPSTAMSCQRLIHEALDPDLKGKMVTIINGSPVIGRPLFILMNNDDATVAVCNRYTGKNLPPLARMADVIVTATGKRGVINGRHMKPGVIIIDAAITREGEHIVGDVKVTMSVRNRVGKITPVPGGVGPVTVAMLLGAVVDLAKGQHSRSKKT